MNKINKTIFINNLRMSKLKPKPKKLKLKFLLKIFFQKSSFYLIKSDE